MADQSKCQRIDSGLQKGRKEKKRHHCETASRQNTTTVKNRDSNPNETDDGTKINIDSRKQKRDSTGHCGKANAEQDSTTERQKMNWIANQFSGPIIGSDDEDEEDVSAMSGIEIFAGGQKAPTEKPASPPAQPKERSNSKITGKKEIDDSGTTQSLKNKVRTDSPTQNSTAMGSAPPSSSCANMQSKLLAALRQFRESGQVDFSKFNEKTVEALLIVALAREKQRTMNSERMAVLNYLEQELAKRVQARRRANASSKNNAPSGQELLNNLMKQISLVIGTSDDPGGDNVGQSAPGPVKLADDGPPVAAPCGVESSSPVVDEPAAFVWPPLQEYPEQSPDSDQYNSEQCRPTSAAQSSGPAQHQQQQSNWRPTSANASYNSPYIADLNSTTPTPTQSGAGACSMATLEFLLRNGLVQGNASSQSVSPNIWTNWREMDGEKEENVNQQRKRGSSTGTPTKHPGQPRASARSFGSEGDMVEEKDEWWAGRESQHLNSLETIAPWSVDKWEQSRRISGDFVNSNIKFEEDSHSVVMDDPFSPAEEESEEWQRLEEQIAEEERMQWQQQEEWHYGDTINVDMQSAPVSTEIRAYADNSQKEIGKWGGGQRTTGGPNQHSNGTPKDLTKLQSNDLRFKLDKARKLAPNDLRRKLPDSKAPLNDLRGKLSRIGRRQRNTGRGSMVDEGQYEQSDSHVATVSGLAKSHQPSRYPNRRWSGGKSNQKYGETLEVTVPNSGRVGERIYL